MIKVNGLKYGVRVVDSPFSSDLDGESDLAVCMITLRADTPIQRQQQTLWHEVMHVILEGETIGAGRSKRDEEFVTRLSNSLFSILQDNSLLSAGWWNRVVDEHAYTEPTLPTPMKTRERRRAITNRPAGEGL